MGCLPLFLQIPVFLVLFHVLRHLKPGTSLDQKTLYGWTAKAFDSAANAKLFGAPISARFLSPQNELSPLGSSVLNVKIVAAALVAIMIVTTFLTSRQMILKTGWSEDPQQRMIQRLMLYGVPFSLLISGGAFPLGVVIYWVTTNLFSLGQQFWVLRKYPPPPMTKSAPGKATSASKSSSGLVGGRSGAAKPGTKAGPAKAGSTRSVWAGVRPVPTRPRRPRAAPAPVGPPARTTPPAKTARWPGRPLTADRWRRRSARSQSTQRSVRRSRRPSHRPSGRRVDATSSRDRQPTGTCRSATRALGAPRPSARPPPVSRRHVTAPRAPRTPEMRHDRYDDTLRRAHLGAGRGLGDRRPARARGPVPRE